MKKILAALTLFLSFLLISSGFAAPSTASVANTDVVKVQKKAFTDLTHASDDAGYAASIHVVCSNGVHRYLGPGDSTFASSTGTACSGGGVTKLIVALNSTVYCKNALPPYQNTYYYTGTNNLPSYQSLKCYNQRPL